MTDDDDLPYRARLFYQQLQQRLAKTPAELPREENMSETKYLGRLLLAALLGLLTCLGFILVVSLSGRPPGDEAAQSPCPLKASDAAVEICFASAITKQDWVNAVTESFNAAQFKTAAGKVITVRAVHVTSGGSKDDILAGKLQPAAWSPGDQSWVDSANAVWEDRTGRALAGGLCPPTVFAPIGFGMWMPMAEALGWPDKRVSWDEIVALAADPQGWGRYGRPEWGQFAFGHPHARYSNFGMLMTAEIAYSTLDRSDGLTPEMIRSPQVEAAMRQVELHTYHYGIQSRNLVDLMARKGPAYLHAVFTAEAEVLKANKQYSSTLAFPLAFIFPAEGTFWTEQPYCILDGAEWMNDDFREAAGIYRDYLLGAEQQARAVDYYLRPLDPAIPLHDPISLENGADPSVTQADVLPLSSPTGAAAEALIDVFLQTKKKAAILLVLDVSGSMQGDKIKNAVEAAANFILRLEPDDEVVVLPFNERVSELQPSGLAREAAEELSRQVRGVGAGGGTALYDAICQAVERVGTMQAADEARGDRRLYGIVVLSDGKDTASSRTVDQMLDVCLPTGESVEGVKVFTIAYGDDADRDLLKRIAERTNGKTFSGDPATIESVYLAISAEQ